MGLIRQGHFLGTKLRSLRKRNGLTLDELSARCVQIDAASAPSVSYLSMVETGKRMPSSDMLGMLAGIFSKDARWFLDENTEVEAAPAAERVAGTALANRHYGPAIRAIADSRLAGNPAQQFPGYRTRG
jgi:transcriptional regulator with XRE-family HTH domain